MLLLPVVQSALHPSPSIVFASSHCYVPTVFASPQIEVHIPATNPKPCVQLTQTDRDTGQDKQ